MTKNHDTIMKRYYVGIGILVAAVMIVGTTILVLGWDERNDKITLRNLYDVNQAITNYQREKQRLPSSLGDAQVGIDSVEYKRLTSDVYVLCASFNTKYEAYRSGSDGSREYLGVDDQLAVDRFKRENPDTTFLQKNNYYYLSDTSHMPGKNCYILFDTQYNNNPIDLPLRDVEPTTD